MIDAKPPKDKEKATGDSAPPPDPDEVLRRMLETPPKPHKDSQTGAPVKVKPTKPTQK